MESTTSDDDGCYGDARDVIGRQSPPDGGVPLDYFAKQRDRVVVDAGSVRPTTKPYACADCRYATDRKNNLRRHRATMHERCERALECCGQSFVSKSELRDHVTERHGAGAGYACAECGRRFGRRALMRRHAAVHALAAAAAGGGRGPPADVQRRRSTVVPRTGRRYNCSRCDYATGHKSNLDRHLRRHAGLPAIAADSQSSVYSGTTMRYRPARTNRGGDDSQPVEFSSLAHRDLNSCRCRICLGNLYYSHQMPPSPPSMSLSSHAPLMFNVLPSSFADVARSFCKSVLPDIDVRQLWSEAQDRSTDVCGGSVSKLVDDPSTSKNTAITGQLRVVDGLHREGPGDRATSPTSSGADETGADTASTGDVTGTCYQRRRRLRLLPLLHTCRPCSLTFVSQLQLKFHSDLFHRTTDLDVAAATRPICCRVNQRSLPNSWSTVYD